MNILNLSDDILSLIKKELKLIRSKKYYEKVKEEFENEWSRRRPYYRVHNSMRRIHEGRFYLTDNPGPIINSQFINHFYRINLLNIFIKKENSIDWFHIKNIYCVNLRLRKIFHNIL